MSVWVRSLGFELSDALRAHAERRLRHVLDRFRMRLRSVVLRLDDVNGPRGGNDKRCRIVAQLAPRGDVRVEEMDGDLYAAIGRAADRLERAVARATERRLQARRFRQTQGGKETVQRRTAAQARDRWREVFDGAQRSGPCGVVSVPSDGEKSEEAHIPTSGRSRQSVRPTPARPWGRS